MKRFVSVVFLTVLVCLGAVSISDGWPWNRPQPTAEISASPTSIDAGHNARLAWSSSNGTAFLDGEGVAPSDEKTVKPAATTTYTLTVQGKKRTAEAEVTVEVKQPPVPPTPPVPPVPPTPPPPPGDSGLSAVGIGSAFSLSDSLSKAAADHDLRGLIEAQSGTWLVIDPLMLDAPHPAAMDAWVKVLTDSNKKQPAVIWYSAKGGKVSVLGIDECGPETTGVALLEKAKSYLSKPTDAVTIQGRTHKLGLIPRDKSKPMAGPRVTAILKPLAAADYPVNTDLAGQFLFLKDQNGYGSCVSQAFTVAYEAACFRAFGPKNATEFSPNFLATLGNGWNGAYGADIAAILMNTGIVPLSTQSNYSRKLPADWKNQAALNRAIGVYGPPDRDSIGYVMAAIKRGLPAVVAIGVGNGFSPRTNGLITFAQGGTPGVNHMVVINGGMFTIDGYKCAKVWNSWGRWGVRGEGWAYIELKFLAYDNDFWVVVVPSANPAYRFDSP